MGAIIAVYLVIGALVAAIVIFVHCDEIIEDFDNDNLSYRTRVLAIMFSIIIIALIWPYILVSIIKDLLLHT